MSPPGTGEDNIQVSSIVTPRVTSAITAQHAGWTEERWQVSRDLWKAFLLLFFFVVANISTVSTKAYLEVNC